jgi:hypothetical protein
MLQALRRSRYKTEENSDRDTEETEENSDELTGETDMSRFRDISPIPLDAASLKESDD